MHLWLFTFCLKCRRTTNPTRIVGCFSRQRNQSSSGGCSEYDEEGTGDSTAQPRPSTTEDQATGGQGEACRRMERGRSGTTQHQAPAYICYAFTNEVEATLGRAFPHLQSDLSSCLPTRVACRWQIHPTFHASHLKAYIRHPEFEREVEPPPPVLVDGELEYEVEAILCHRGKGAQR